MLDTLLMSSFGSGSYHPKMLKITPKLLTVKSTVTVTSSVIGITIHCIHINYIYIYLTSMSMKRKCRGKAYGDNKVQDNIRNKV